MYCGMTSTWNGSITEASVIAKYTDRIRNCSRASAYAVSEQENRLPTIDPIVTISEFTKNAENGRFSACQPSLKFSNVTSCGMMPGSVRIWSGGLNALTTIQSNG